MDGWNGNDAMDFDVVNPGNLNVRNNPQQHMDDSDEELQNADSDEEVQNADSDEEVQNADSDEEVQNADSGEEHQNVDSEDEHQNVDSEDEHQNVDSEDEHQNVDSEEEVQRADSENSSVAHADSSFSSSDDEQDIADVIEPVGETFSLNIEGYGLDVLLRTAENGNTLAWEQFLLVLAKSLQHKECYKSMLATFEIMNRAFVNGPFPENMRQFWRIVNRKEENFSSKIVCTVCWTTLGEGKVPIRNCTCIPVQCGPGRSNSELGTMFYIDLRSQLEGLLGKAGIAVDLLYPYTRTKRNVRAIEDVYDGTVYKHHSAEGEFLHQNNHNYSLAMWVDGVSPVKSANVHVVPVFFQVLELSPRARQRNSLLAALYVGPRKPMMGHYLAPVATDLQELYLNGVTWRPNHNEERISRFMLLIVSADAEERYAIFGMTRHNGHFGCPCCFVDGERLDPENNQNRLIYPVQNEENVADRTDDNIRAHSREANETGAAIFGVKSISALYLLDVDLRTSMLIEPLHCLWKGNFVRLYNNLTNSERPNNILSRNITTISNRIKSIRVPTKISRSPRGLTNFQKFTATEQRNTAWFYWLPCAQDFMDPNQLRLSALFAEATFVLNQDSIPQNDLRRAAQLIEEYRRLFQATFLTRGEWVYNLHLLKHWARCIEELGPAFVASGFWFESLNRQVVNYLTSPNDRASQVANRMLLGQMLEKCLDMPLTLGTRRLLRKYIGKERWDQPPNVAAGVYVIIDDIGRQDVFSDQQIAALRDAQFNNVDREIPITKHKKACIDGVVYQVPSARITKYNNSIVHVNLPRNRIVNFIEIESIVTWRNGNQRLQGIFGTPFNTTGLAFETTYMHTVERRNDLVYVALTNVITPGILVEACGQTYISRLPNKWDND